MILNYSPFTAEIVDGWDHCLKPYFSIILSAAFEAKPGCAVRLAKAASSSHPVDHYFGAPGRSSVRYEADIAPEKPRVDVLINGRAYAPGARATKQVVVSIRVADIFKPLLVTGDRYRTAVLGVASTPRPFVTMPIVYERASGGTVPVLQGGSCDGYNPVGVGYKHARSLDPAVETEFPNVEHLDGRPGPVGFGIVARHWQPRLKLAGTYDARWLADRWPLLPADFKPEHHQAAPADQQSDKIRGGELVEVLNMTPEGKWFFRLPTLRVPIHLWYADRGETATLALDTVLLEPDAYLVTLKARVKIPIVRHRGPLRQAIVGDITGGWWRSRLARKIYRDPLGSNGRPLNPVEYEV